MKEKDSENVVLRCVWGGGGSVGFIDINEKDSENVVLKARGVGVGSLWFIYMKT